MLKCCLSVHIGDLLSACVCMPQKSIPAHLHVCPVRPTQAYVRIAKSCVVVDTSQSQYTFVAASRVLISLHFFADVAYLPLYTVNNASQCFVTG